jgi:hypothetical protein
LFFIEELQAGERQFEYVLQLRLGQEYLLAVYDDAFLNGKEFLNDIGIELVQALCLDIT